MHQGRGAGWGGRETLGLRGERGTRRVGGGRGGATDQWASAAAFYDVATPSQVVGGPPLGSRALLGFVGRLAGCPQKWQGVSHQAGPLWTPPAGGGRRWG